MAGAELGRDHRELPRQVLDHGVAQRLFEPGGEPSAADEAGSAETDVEIAEHAARGEMARPFLESVELAVDMTAADHRADRGADDHIGNDAVFMQHAQHADMREAARGAAAERKADAWAAASARLFSLDASAARSSFVRSRRSSCNTRFLPGAMIGPGWRADKSFTRLW